MQRFLYFLDQNRKHVEARNQIENRYPADFAVLWWKCQKQPPEVFYKKAVLKNFATSARITVLESPFRNLKDLKLKTPNMCFPVNIVKFLRLPILKNICQRLFFDCSNGSLLHGPKVSSSILYDGVRLQDPSHEANF